MAERIEVLKTYKLYINGKFPRTESGRYYKPKNAEGEELGNICLASRKDFRNSVVAARKAQAAWQGRSAFNRSQILYRIAENLESRKAEMTALLIKEESLKSPKAKQLVEESIDSLIYFAGWCDKIQQLFSAVNPVASSHFNFSVLEPTGVVSAIFSEKTNFNQFVSSMAAVISTGNVAVFLAKEEAPLSAITFAEVLQHSDLPMGVVNILTGREAELAEQFASHMDVNAFLSVGGSESNQKNLQLLAAENLKRWVNWPLKKKINTPYAIKDFLEVKTTWHPIEQIGGATAGY